MSVPYDQTVLTANVHPAGGEEAGAVAGKAVRSGGRSSGDGASRAGQPAMRAALGAAFISSSAILVTLAHTGPATAAFYRCALALPVLIPLALLEQRRRGPRPLRTRLWAGAAGLLLAADLVMWNHAIADVGAGVATVLGNLQVLFVGLLAWLLYAERPGRRYLTLLPVVLLGVVLVSGLVGGSTSGGHPMAGVAYGFGTSATYAGFLLILRQTAGPSRHVAGQLADATLGAAVGSLLIGLSFGGLDLHIPWPSFGWLLALALISQTAGWLLITSSLPGLPAAVSSLLLLLQPAATMVLGAIVLHELPTLIQVAGGVLVCSGVLAVTWKRRPRSEPVTPREEMESAAPQPVTANSTYP
jgi:drug/metabolite transporter (DMT)-like permease